MCIHSFNWIYAPSLSRLFFLPFPCYLFSSSSSQREVMVLRKYSPFSDFFFSVCTLFIHFIPSLLLFLIRSLCYAMSFSIVLPSLHIPDTLPRAYRGLIYTKAIITSTLSILHTKLIYRTYTPFYWVDKK